MNEQHPTLVLFDIDGTLLASDSAGRAAFELALAELFHLSHAMDGISFAGSTDWRILEQVLLPAGYSRAEVAASVPAFAEALARHLQAIIPRYRVRALPGTLALVEALAVDPRARLGLVTGNMALSVPIKLRAAGFDPAHFPVGAYGHEAADRNALPPLAVSRARAYWRQDFPPERIVIVGDTANDVICARSVGGRALAVLTGPASREEVAREKPYAILEDLADRRAVEAILFGEGGDG